MNDHQDQGNPEVPPAPSEQALSRPVPPTLLRVYADNQDKRTLCIFWIIFFCIIILITGVSFGLPDEVIYKANEKELKGTNLEGCQSPSMFNDNRELACYNGTDRLGVVMTELTRNNQFAVIFLVFGLINSKAGISEMTYKTRISLHQVKTVQRDGKGALLQVKKVESKDWFDQTLHTESAIAMYGDDDKTVLGYKFPLYALRDFGDESDVLLIQTEPSLETLRNIDSVGTEYMVVNPKFTVYSIVLRYVYFVISVVGLVLYGARFRTIPASERILEQKMVLVLSVLLVMFNDPLYPVTVLYPNKASSYFSVFFVINFVIFLLFLWIVFLDRIFYEDGQKQTQLLNWKRIGYILVTYFLALILYTEIAFDHIEGLPIVATEDMFTNKFVALEILVLFMVMLGFIYILVQYVRVCMAVDEKMWRNQLFMFFSLFFLFITLVMFFVNGFSINDMSGNRILLLFTIMNMYTLYMQYMYSITNQERDHIDRGAVYALSHNNDRQGGFGLLENGSDGGDCVDLEFRDIIQPGPIFKQDPPQQGWGSHPTKEERKRVDYGDELEEEPEHTLEKQMKREEEVDFFEKQAENNRREKEEQGFEQFELE